MGISTHRLAHRLAGLDELRLWDTDHGYDAAISALETSLKKLKAQPAGCFFGQAVGLGHRFVPERKRIFESYNSTQLYNSRFHIFSNSFPQKFQGLQGLRAESRPFFVIESQKIHETMQRRI